MSKGVNGVWKMIIIVLILCYILLEGTKMGLTYFSINNMAKEATDLYKVEKTNTAVIQNAKDSLKAFQYEDSIVEVKDKKLYIKYKYKGIMTRFLGVRPSFTVSDELPQL